MIKLTEPQREALELIAVGKPLQRKNGGYRCRMRRKLLDLGLVEDNPSGFGVVIADRGRHALAGKCYCGCGSKAT